MFSHGVCLRVRAHGSALLLTLAILVTACFPTITWSKPPKNDGGSSGSQQVVRVEEDWELVITTPDPNSASPQVNCLISPFGHADTLYATFELNHKSITSDESGGMQLQVWNGESPVGLPQLVEGMVMSSTGEAVRWTQVMELKDGVLTFEMAGGDSTTWGTFGKPLTTTSGGVVFGQTTTTTSTTSTSSTDPIKSSVSLGLTELNTYNPQVSVANSGIAFGANRVQSLVLKKVRRILSDGSVVEDTTTRTVFPQN